MLGLDVNTLSTLIEFRSGTDTLAVIVQTIFLGFTLAIALGILYIFFTILAVIFHHVAFDKLEQIPGFIMKSMAAVESSGDSSSEEESYDYEEMQAILSMEKTIERAARKTLRKKRKEEVASIAPAPTYSKKTLLLSEFLERKSVSGTQITNRQSKTMNE